ncbi:VOC family protein [Streptomyces sp. NBC_01558]|uniref:VOC family protein n=1 Tax=Streptomyces sp. NBC_01558 TaxID=2975878 RepID=UPI002DDB725F|nr:VOC family protein [Streptomyces sp. NBC_01558]WSD74987.1 VOC family protein [Streptomyces sp. NBC_01558]
MEHPVHAQLYPYLSYADAGSALGWFEAVGFQILTRQDDADGRVIHAEARLGDVRVMVASSDADYLVPPLHGLSTGMGLYLQVTDVADVDAWHARAVEAGGREVMAPQDTEWDSRRARVLDPQGREWSIGTYQPGRSW